WLRARRHGRGQDPDPAPGVDQRGVAAVRPAVERTRLVERREAQAGPRDVSTDLDPRLHDRLVDVLAPFRAGDPVDPLQGRQVTLDAVRIGHQDAHVDRVVRRGQDGQVGGGELPHRTSLRTSSSVHEEPSRTRRSRPAWRPPLTVIVCDPHAAGSARGGEEATVSTGPPAMDWESEATPSRERVSISSTSCPATGAVVSVRQRFTPPEVYRSWNRPRSESTWSWSLAAPSPMRTSTGYPGSASPPSSPSRR